MVLGILVSLYLCCLGLQIVRPSRVKMIIRAYTVGLCKDPILFDLVSYVDVRVQSNPFILKGDKRVLV